MIKLQGMIIKQHSPDQIKCKDLNENINALQSMEIYYLCKYSEYYNFKFIRVSNRLFPVRNAKSSLPEDTDDRKKNKDDELESSANPGPNVHCQRRNAPYSKAHDIACTLWYSHFRSHTKHLQEDHLK